MLCLAARTVRCAPIKGPVNPGKVDRPIKTFPGHHGQSTTRPTTQLQQDVVTSVQSGASALAGAIAALTLVTAPVGVYLAAEAITYKELQNKTYNEVRGSGLAAVCPVIEEGTTNLSEIKAGNYKLQQLCMEPTNIWVKEEGVTRDSKADWVKATLLTRQTTNLSDITADVEVGPGGQVSFKEDDSYSLNLAPITVQVPGGARVPFLFTIKELQASGDLARFGSTFQVPSYRGSSFLDPKGRGGSQGYDAALALQTKADVDELQKENNKSFAPLEGKIAFSVVKYDSMTGEMVGIFESLQPSDTDMGAKAPKEVRIGGIWYGQLACTSPLDGHRERDRCMQLRVVENFILSGPRQKL